MIRMDSCFSLPVMDYVLSLQTDITKSAFQGSLCLLLTMNYDSDARKMIFNQKLSHYGELILCVLNYNIVDTRVPLVEILVFTLHLTP